MNEITIKKEKKKVTDLTKGKPLKLILSFYWPLLLTSMLQQFYNFADTWIVGKGLGDDALAAVGNMGSLFFLIVGFSFGIANGFGIMIAQSYGAGDMEELKHRLAGIIELGIIIALWLTLLSVIYLPTVLRLLRTDELIFEDSLRYGYVIFGGLASAICYNISAAVLRALGDSKTPLKAIIVSSVVNVSLNSLFIFGFHMGAEGVGIATICAQVISAAFCISRLKKISFIKLEKRHFKNGANVFLDLLKNGLPMALMNSITAVGCMVVQYFINGYGVVYTAAYAACSKYLNLFMNPASTAGSAMSAYTGQNYGAREYGRIKEGLKVCLGISACAYLLLGSLLVFVPSMLAGILLSGTEQIELVCGFLPKCGAMLIFVDFLFVFRSAVQGMGKPLLPMISGIAEMIIRIFIISFFMERIGFDAAAYAEIGAWVGACLINAFALMAFLAPFFRKKQDTCALRAM
ncbi:MAG: MATE family efflux transporter [Lachnospiraceae bacterium]|jgi:putative MATE family efflux protein|nr:MATE family efflux transporter [Lachnospiraceae bacterium]